MLIRFDFSRTRRRYGLQDPDDIFRRGARHYRRTCEELVRGELRPVHWPAEEPWEGADLFVYGHTHTQDADRDRRLASAPRAFANTGTWTRKVIRITTNLKLPPVFVPIYELTYVTVERVGGGDGGDASGSARRSSNIACPGPSGWRSSSAAARRCAPPILAAAYRQAAPRSPFALASIGPQPLGRSVTPRGRQTHPR